MASQNASDLMIDILHQWGVDVVFGIPGDGINGIIEAFRKRQNDIKFIQVRHEEGAAFAATAYAKLTGKLGVCVATSGPGGLHLLNGLYDAKLDGAPVLAITGMQFHDLIGTYTQQDVELDKVFQDVCVYNQRIMGAAHVENIVELACRTALARRGVAHITMPVDQQEEIVKKAPRSMRNIPHHISNIMASRPGLPSEAALRDAAEILNHGKKIAIMAGRGAIGAGKQLEEIAARLNAVVVKPLLGKGCLPDDNKYCMGGVGLLGTKPSHDALESCDTLFIVGSTFPYIEFYPKPDQAKCVQLDIDPARISLRYPADVGLIGDTKKSLELLLPLLKQSGDSAFFDKISKVKDQWNDLMHIRGTVMDGPLKPQVVAHEINRNLKNDAIILSDSGTIATWFARHIHIREGQQCTLSGNLATMACGLPYAVGAQIAYPNRQVVALVGDGGFTMLMGEMITAKKYNLPIKIVVFKNNGLGQIKWEQIVMLGNPEYVCDLEPFDFVKFAEAVGVRGVRADDPKTCGAVIADALNSPGPCVIEAVVDPHEPPLPAHIEFTQALKFAEAIAKGTPDAAKIVKTVVKDKVRELI